MAWEFWDSPSSVHALWKNGKLGVAVLFLGRFPPNQTLLNHLKSDER
jgi:hypothetical protein